MQKTLTFKFVTFTIEPMQNGRYNVKAKNRHGSFQWQSDDSFIYENMDSTNKVTNNKVKSMLYDDYRSLRSSK